MHRLRHDRVATSTADTSSTPLGARRDLRSVQLMPLVAVTSAPFGLQSLSGDAVPHPTWRNAHTEALAALRREKSVAVLGLPGTGKTFLLYRLGQTLRSEGLRVRSSNTLQALGLEFQTDVLLVDEADRLPNEALDALRDRDGLFILAGLPELAQRLGYLACPIVTVTLKPLSPEDVARFVAARLSATGHRRDLFEPAAVLALAQHSAGLLRLVIVLAGSAMFLAEHEGAERVSKQHVDEAATMREIGNDDQGTEQELAQPSWPTPSFVPVPTAARPEQELHSIPPLWVNRFALGLGGLLLSATLGWLLLPSHHYSPVPTLPQREATLVSPPASASVLPTTTPDLLPPAAAPPLATSLVQAPVAPPILVGQSDVGPAPSPRVPARIVPPASLRQTEPAEAFQGLILNETMNQTGQLSLDIRRSSSTNVTATFHAFAGLIGSGGLAGTITADGRIIASGRLMMGRNPFDTTLTATIIGNRLEGTAIFVRPETGSAARSRFSLTRL